MSHALDIVLSDFKSDVERVENLLTLTKLFRDFGASKALENEPAWKEALDLHKASEARRTDLPILAGSLLLYLTGRFEYCVRQIVEAMVDDIVSKTDNYQCLPHQIRKSIKQKTLEIAQNPKKYGHDEITSEAILESFVLNIKGTGQGLTVKSEVLSITDANMRPAVLQDLLKTVGLTEFWRDMGRQANIKIALEKSIDQEAAIEAQSRLNEIMEERNQIAHPTNTTQFPDADKVLKVAEFLKVLSSNTVDLSKVYLSSYRAKEEPQAIAS